LKVSRETARNQLKSVFADTRRQSALVVLLLQVELRLLQRAVHAGFGKRYDVGA
jgi:hypothetical protein